MMAGTNPSFNSTLFREKIKFAMNMGLPTANGEKATFRWDPVVTNTVADSKGRPYDFSVTPATQTQHPDVKIDCAIDFVGSRNIGEFTPVGRFDTARAIVTVLDEDYLLVAGSSKVILGGSTYLIDYWAPPMGLFDVTVYQAYIVSQDES